MAKLGEWSLPTPEACGSNPVLAKFKLNIVYCQLYKKDNNKVKEAGNGPFLKNMI